jgi:tetratricopeptide (TPR) repeat protein
VKNGKAIVLGAIALPILVAGVVALQVIRERTFPEREQPARQVLYLSSPAVLTRLALSYDALVADLYWIRAIQYYGGTRLSDAADKSYDLLYPLLDLTTSLDPNFNIAYEFGAFFLSEKPPGGPGRSDLAIRLLEKGIKARPDRFQYPYDIGFVHYRNGNYSVAADWFERAAATSGARKEGERADLWLKPLAASTRATGGDTRSARLMYQQLLKADAAWLRNDARRRLKQLDAIDQIAELQRRVMEYERRFGDPPPTWDDMLQTGYLSGVPVDQEGRPVDPEGFPYLLNKWWGDVTINADSPLWPLPTENPA